MTDNVCDSWEDVDVDNIVIKPASKVKNKKANETGQFPTDTTNKSFNIEENGGNIVVNNANSISTTSQVTNAFKIMQRAPGSPTEPTATTAQTNSKAPFISYSSVALRAEATPFECQPKVIIEDSNRTQFVAKLRILNRPNSKQDQVKDARSSADVHKQLLKSFEEKQAEYAKARLRILGEEMPVEALKLNDISDALDNVSVGQAATEKQSSNNSTNSSPSKTVTSKNSDVVIIREPTVPDGTRGFHNSR